MGIFDVVKDVAKVGAEILPIVLDNMPTGTQSQKTVPLGPIKVSVDGDQIYATNLGDQPKDVIFSVTNFTGGAMRSTNEIYNIEHGTSIVLPRLYWLHSRMDWSASQIQGNTKVLRIHLSAIWV